MTSGGASVPSVCGKTPQDDKNKLPDPVKVIKVLTDVVADPTSGEKKLPVYEDEASFSWTHRYPAKLKAVLWNFTQTSANTQERSSPSHPPLILLLSSESTTRPPGRTMKYMALGTAVLLFLGILSLVLAHRDEGSPVHKYGMAFTLDDAIQAHSEKRVLIGVPGESSVISSVTTTEATTSSPTPIAVTAASADTVNNESATDADSAPVTTLSPAKETENRDVPAEGAILIGSDDDDKSIDDNDQRIVFIERLMGLHLSSPNDSQGGSDASVEEDQMKKKAMDKQWENNVRKFKNPSSDSGASADMQPHPMLKYAAAAMMSRLIAAAARAQMETQAREALLMRGGAKDKDDDAEEESVPVLLASLRAGEGPEMMRSLRPPVAPHMYGRPMSRSARGPLGPQSPRMASMAHQRILPAPQASQAHPLMQQLQALQILSALQRVQRQRESVFQAPIESRSGPTGEKGTPALVMVAIPIQSQESRQQVQQVTPPYMHQPVAHYRSYYPYASPYSAYSAYRPVPHPHPASASYHMPLHALPPPPPPHHQAYRPYSHAAPYVAQPMPRSPAMHPAYSHLRPVIEVPVEVPVPYHVPVPVAAYPAATVQAHSPHSFPVPNGRSDEADNSPADSDQIVLFYDAELQNDNENQDNSGNNNNDDLQSSASERRQAVHSGKSHQFLASQQLPSNPSANKLKLFREIMNQKHASNPGVRYLPISLSPGDGETGAGPVAGSHLQSGRLMQGQESQAQPAFIVIADDGEQPQAVERRR